MKITLPWPPTVNTYYSVVRGRKILSKKGREYNKYALQKIAKMKLGEPISSRVEVDIFLYPPDNRRRDIDNYLKAPLDSLTKAKIWEDDRQVKRLNISMAEDGGKPGYVDIYVREY
jgi:crossover junction endodeoxyribonuclease RusA